VDELLVIDKGSRIAGHVLCLFSLQDLFSGSRLLGCAIHECSHWCVSAMRSDSVVPASGACETHTEVLCHGDRLSC
jgi:hypothetical protein